LNDILSNYELKGGIDIYFEPKHDYARIRVAYFLPDQEIFKALDMIAGHIKAL
jgi:hypothetical protein